MTITLPDEIKADLEAEAKAEGFSTVDEYVYIMYVRAKLNYGPQGENYMADHSLGIADDTDTPERVAANRERLRALIREGIESGPATPMTPDDWADLRRRLDERLAARGVKAWASAPKPAATSSTSPRRSASVTARVGRHS